MNIQRFVDAKLFKNRSDRDVCGIIVINASQDGSYKSAVVKGEIDVLRFSICRNTLSPANR